ncbi:MAG: hypothetical protein HQ517_06440 [SAR324 cluster bacterium]|nr:hypothetical protein [SAR324 cluster bacterium]
MDSNENVMFVYPGAPFIGEAIMHLLLAFDNEPTNDGRFSPREREHSQIAIALIMVALESLVKIKLHEQNDIEPHYREDLFLNTLEGYTKEHGALEFWNELYILRNQIIHSAYFESSNKGSTKSAATIKRLKSAHTIQYIDMEKEITKAWELSINPLSVTRYEAFTCLLFFYWYGKKTGIWISNLPLDTPYVDGRMKSNLRGKWIDTDIYSKLIGSGSDYTQLLGFLWNRLSSRHKTIVNEKSKEQLGINLSEYYNTAVTMLDMFKNSKNFYGYGKGKRDE